MISAPLFHFPFSDPLSLKHMNNLTIHVSLWPERPRAQENGKWFYTSFQIDGAYYDIFHSVLEIDDMP